MLIIPFSSSGLMRTVTVLLVLAPLVACDNKRQSAESPLDRFVKSDQRALQLAKGARTRLGNTLYFGEPDPNEYQIRSLMSRIKGDIRIIGWRTRSVDDDTYVVSYTYAESGNTTEEKGWAFEVKLSSELVRSVIGDPDLEQKYGWSSAK
jgi:hypothetical protein